MQEFLLKWTYRSHFWGSTLLRNVFYT
ncbi:hypothetical protein LINPERPRIM_LOCUS37182 [Linum perenne]